MTKTYRVHEFAELAGVTAKALRHYDRLGVLKPLRTAAGYRVYNEKDFARVEQVVALKFLGLPLKQIRQVLDRGIPLAEALLGQRTALEEKRQLLDRAIRAIRSVEGVLAKGAKPDSAILRQLIEAITMQNNLQTMKQYYSDEAWEKLTRLRQQRVDGKRNGISQSWEKLIREANSLLGADPASARVQKLCSRWFDLWQSTTGGDPGVQEGHRKALADRANWPPEMSRFTIDFDSKAIEDFLSKACAASMKKYYSKKAWARKITFDRTQIDPAWKALQADVRAALDEPPSSETGRALAKRWLSLTALSTQGDPAIERGAKRAWKNREHWPLPLRQHSDQSRMPEIADWIGKAIHALRQQTRSKECQK